MASGGGRDNTNPLGSKDDIKKRTEIIKGIFKYWRDLQKRWGAKDIALKISNDPKVGGYYQPEMVNEEGKKEKAYIVVSIPTGITWANAVNKLNPKVPTSAVEELKFIVRAELSHHRQYLKKDVDKNPDWVKPGATWDEKIHGPAYEKQLKQIGGGKDFRGQDREFEHVQRRILQTIARRKQSENIRQHENDRHGLQTMGSDQPQEPYLPPIRTGPPQDDSGEDKYWAI